MMITAINEAGGGSPNFAGLSFTRLILFSIIAKKGVIYQGKEGLIMLAAPVEKGQGLVEYALIIILIAILLLASLSLVTGALNVIFSRIASSI
jgi:pilus assembly protein Flp/PilA